MKAVATPSNPAVSGRGVFGHVHDPLVPRMTLHPGGVWQHSAPLRRRLARLVRIYWGCPQGPFGGRMLWVVGAGMGSCRSTRSLPRRCCRWWRLPGSSSPRGPRSRSRRCPMVRSAEAIAGLAALEAQAQAWRLALEAEAEARALAERDAATGTDAWVAALTGSTREVAAGGIRLARLLETKYAATREAFAAGRLRIEQVRVIVNAAEQIPASATPEQVADGRGVAGRPGHRRGHPRPPPPRRPAAAPGRAPDVRPDLPRADDSPTRTCMLGREHRAAEAETWLSLGDNGNGTYTGRFVIPELHGQLLQRHLDTLSAPRRLSRDRHGHQVSDPTPARHRAGALADRTPRPGVHRAPRAPAHRRPRRQRHHPARHPRPGRPADRARCRPARDRRPPHRRRGPPTGLQRRTRPRRPGHRLRTPGPRPRDPPAHQGPTPGPVPDPRHLRRHRLPTPLRLDRDPPPPPLVPRRPHRPRQRPPPVLLPPPPRPRHPLRPPPHPRRRLALPPTDIGRSGSAVRSFLTDCRDSGPSPPDHRGTRPVSRGAS